MLRKVKLKNVVRLERYAAIDVGSNAIRILFSNVLFSKGKVPEIHKAHLVRTPIRLGEDVFTKGEVSEDKKEKMIHAFKAFYHLMKVYDIKSYLAFGTSAMRNAKNSSEIIKLLKKETGIELELIDGKREAEIIFSTQLSQHLDFDKNYLYMDVGGGSVELTIFSQGEIKRGESFKLGTIRLLNNGPQIEEEWKRLFSWIKTNTKGVKDICLIGSGGNINKIFKMSGTKKDSPMHINALEDIFEDLDSISFEERIEKYSLNPDRADVIVPASNLFIEVMHAAKSQEILVPKMGLADGMIRSMVQENVGVLV